MRTKTAVLRIVAPLGVAALLLSGCSGGGAPAETESSAPAGPFTLRVNWGGFPVTWAPGSAAMQAGHLRIPYETLLTRTSDGQIHPNLATEWEYGEGSMSLTLTLRDDVVFQDGTPFNAEAVKTNIEYVKDVVGGQYGGPIAAGVKSIDVVDDSTVTINFTRPYGTFTTLLTQQNLPMGSPAAIADGSIETHPVGTSPWAYDESKSTAGSMMYFGRFDDYWGEMPAAENIELYAIPDDTAAVAAVISGEIDVTDAEAEQVPRIEESSDVDWYQYPALRNNITFFDRGPDGVLGDENVRQALCYALDVPVYASLDTTTHAADQHFIEGEPGYSADIDGYPHDLDKAEELLAEAGNPTLDLTIPAAPFNKQQVEIYAEQMNELPGVTVTVQDLAVPEYVATWSSGQFPLGIGSHPQITPQDWYGAWWADTARTNPSGWASDELKALAGQAYGAGDTPDSDEAWAAVMKEVADEALVCGHMQVDQVIAYNNTTVADVQPSEAVWEVNLIDYWAVKPAS
ncbi:peptide/nickel transport system substrate-binding protein [Microbacterium sp. cf046]|uniref:ABC transporter substrate-binding protein n=1 Tax=Microbacterium sp. cf046 TaxID=1761803 RepID=UPI0008E7A001|nr:ABC transporter substrate-binding protein [Microbacterium sp. cf046]SFR89539.1 peptide/nickel transport system substrate-binding protein [Microbacterium sp. cf046]